MNSFYYQLDAKTEGFVIQTDNNPAQNSNITRQEQVTDSAHEILNMKADQLELRAKLGKLQQGFTHMSYKSIGIAKSYMQLIKQKSQFMQVAQKMQAKTQKYKNKCLELENELSDLKTKEEQWKEQKQRVNRLLDKAVQILKLHPEGAKIAAELNQVLAQ